MLFEVKGFNNFDNLARYFEPLDVKGEENYSGIMLTSNLRFQNSKEKIISKFDHLFSRREAAILQNCVPIKLKMSNKLELSGRQKKPTKAGKS